MHVLILAGGGGTRLWPLSKHDFPKQFLHFGDKYTLLQKTLLRFLGSPFAKTISIIANPQHLPLIEKQLSAIDPAKTIHIILEPAGKNTAPAIALGVKWLQEHGIAKNEDQLLVLPSDHLIEPQSVFLETLQKAQAQLSDHPLILFGIQPTKPETGYGYIQTGTPLHTDLYSMGRFVEKPTLEIAKEYLISGDYFWNSGIIACNISHFWNLLKEHAPHIAYLQGGTFQEATSHFIGLPSISFDYAVLEKCSRAALCPLPITWSDVGSWDSVYEISSKDQNQNVFCGQVNALNTKNSLIFGGKRLISTIGIEDLLIVETEEALFICKRGDSQKIKEILHQN